jgi:hypothetical protein
MADHGPSLADPAEDLPARAADRFGGRDARKLLEFLIPRVDPELRPERHQRVARAKVDGDLLQRSPPRQPRLEALVDEERVPRRRQ